VTSALQDPRGNLHTRERRDSIRPGCITLDLVVGSVAILRVGCRRRIMKTWLWIDAGIARGEQNSADATQRPHLGDDQRLQASARKLIPIPRALLMNSTAQIGPGSSTRASCLDPRLACGSAYWSITPVAVCETLRRAQFALI